MGGLSFLNGLFLAAGAVGLVPIIIHLIQRRKIQQVVFGSVRFLRKMSRRVVRRRRLTELILILLRVAALVMLAMAFARPFFWKTTQRLGSETVLGQEALMVLIDNSYSMRVGGRLDRAKKQALEVLDDLDPATVAGVGSFAGQFQLLSPIGASPDEATRAVKDIQPTWGATNLEGALVAAQAELTREDRREEQIRIVLISDFQKISWREGARFRLGPDTVLEPVDVSGGSADNVFVERVVVPRLIVAGGEREVIRANVQNASDKPVRNAEVVFHVAGRAVQRQRVDIKPRSVSSVHFGYTFANVGDTVGKITVAAADELQDDNTAYFCVNVTPRIRVLLVAAKGAGAGKSDYDDEFFLTKAMVPDKASPLAVTSVRPQALVPSHLKGADVVLLANVSELAPATVKALEAFVAGGGGVGFFCGAGCDADKFNASLKGLAPCTLWKHARAKDAVEPVAISWVDYRHEIFQPFAGPRTGDFGTPLFFQYFLVRDSQMSKVYCRFNTGHPMLLERKIGKGKSVLVTTSTDMKWNTLPVKSIFPPLVHQIVKRLCAERVAGDRNVPVSEQVTHRLGEQVKAAELRTPDGSKRKLTVSKLSSGEENIVSFTADRPGLYEIDHGAAKAAYAANMDGREPDLAHLDMQLWQAKVKPLPGERVQGSGGAALLAQSTARERAEAQQRIWAYLVGLVLLALALEMIVAARSGSG